MNCLNPYLPPASDVERRLPVSIKERDLGYWRRFALALGLRAIANAISLYLTERIMAPMGMNMLDGLLRSIVGVVFHIRRNSMSCDF